MLMIAVRWVQGRPEDYAPSQHVQLVDRLATERWNAFVATIRPRLFDRDPLADSVFAIVEAHRQPFRDLRSTLDAASADVLRDGNGLDDALDLLLHRWSMARARVIDDPHDAIERLTAIGVGLAQHAGSCFVLGVVDDLLIALRLAGWRLDQLADAQPIAQLCESEPEIGCFVEAILRGEDEPRATLATVEDLAADSVTVH